MNYFIFVFFLYEVFKGYICILGDKFIIYEDIKYLFIEYLFNLMVFIDLLRCRGRLGVVKEILFESYIF